MSCVLPTIDEYCVNWERSKTMKESTKNNPKISVKETLKRFKERYFRLIDESNKLGDFSDFIFEDDGFYYRVSWDGHRWSDPQNIKLKK
jgi:hypothetical protein